MMRPLQDLATFVAELTLADVPAGVVERAHWVLRDTVGVIIGGMAEPEVRALAAHAAARATGPSLLLGHGGRTSPDWAVLVHGAAGTTLEMDEGHAYARGHAAIHAIPPALALAPGYDAAGAEVMVAMIAGYEVAARAGVATRLRPPVHPFGAWGVLGAAAVAGRYRGLDPAALAGALELAASYAITPSFASAFQGATVRNTYAGLVNRLGLLAVDLYELGFRGERGGLETTFGQILGQRFDAAALNDGLGRRYEMSRGYFKPYSGCRYTHAAIDAVLALQTEAPVDLTSLDRIEVATYDIAARLADPAPATPLAGRFSLPYVVAATLTFGSAGPEIFTPERLAEPSVRDLARRIALREDPALTALTPAHRPARVRLHFQDGRKREMLVLSSKGDPDQPLTAEELQLKFAGLVAPALGRERAALAWTQLGRLAVTTDVAALLRLLAPQDAGGEGAPVPDVAGTRSGSPG